MYMFHLLRHRASTPLRCLTPRIEAYFHVTDTDDEVEVQGASFGSAKG